MLVSFYDFMCVTKINHSLILALPSSHRRIVVALYNYNAREETDVSFVKGDRMEVIDDTESDWWRVIVSNEFLSIIK